ncbi:hypothetical protein GCM10027059_19790 [Myceligenerans halotolerans]
MFRPASSCCEPGTVSTGREAINAEYDPAVHRECATMRRDGKRMASVEHAEAIAWIAVSDRRSCAESRPTGSVVRVAAKYLVEGFHVRARLTVYGASAW